MKKSNKGFVVTLVITIVALLIIGGGVYLYSQNKSQQVSQQPVVSNQVISTSTDQYVASTTNIQTEGLKTYTNTQYGFSLLYPNSLTLNPVRDYVPHPFTNPQIVYLYIDNNSVQTEGYVTFNISSDNTDVSNCTQSNGVGPTDLFPTNSLSNISTSSSYINSVQFIQSDNIFNNQSGIERNYTTLHNGMCYEIEITSFPDSCVNSGCDGRLWTTDTEMSLLKQFDTIARSFTFK